MTLSNSRKIALGATALGLVLAAPAWAQAGPDRGEFPVIEGEGGVAEESTTAEAFDTRNTIIVTARRVEEDLQDVPISITVYDQEQLSQRNVAVATDLAVTTPSLTVDQRFGPEKATFAIRGFVQETSTSPTVGVYFADVVGVRSQGGTTSGNTVGAGSFTDLQNVQILKGPQGTLFGRNTTGGAVLLVPQKPTPFFEGYVEGTYGNYDQKRLQAAINVPLAETFQIRLATDINKRDGYIRNLSGIGPDDYANVDYQYFRLSMVGQLTDRLENYTIFTYSDSDTNGYASRYVGCDRAAPSPLAGGSLTRYATATAACDQLDRQAARGDSPYEVEVSNPDPRIHLRTWQVINTTTWEASDNLTIKNIASYGEFREDSAFNLYSDNFAVSDELFQVGQILASLGAPVRVAPAGSPFTYIQLDEQPGFDASSQSSVTEELQLQGEFDRFNFVVGGYLEFSRPIGTNQQRTGIFGDCASPGNVTCAAPLGFALISQSRTQFDFDNHGIFAQGTYEINDQFALTLGGRYTFDTVSGVGESSRITLAPTPIGVIPISQTCNDSLTYPTVNVIALRGQIASGAVPECRTEIEVSSKEPTWLINLDYKPNDDILIYGKYARGYRQGGINFTNPGLETWQPEQVDSYEIGAKTSFFFGAVDGYFNVAGFYNQFKDQQVFAQLIPKPAFAQLLSGGAGIINAGKSTVKGFELDTAATFADIFNLAVAYTYLDTKIKELVVPTLAPNAPFIAPIPLVGEGDPLTYSPKHRLSVTGSVDLPVPERIGDISFGATYVYTSEQFTNAVLGQTPGLEDAGLLKATDLVNLNFSWEKVFGSPIDLALFATNVTNELVEVGTGGAFASAGILDKLYGPPRMYGLRVRFNFGE